MMRTEDITLWLANEAPQDTVNGLFAGFCQEIVRSGIPVWRASLGLEVLHPEVSGWQHVWTDESLSVRVRPGHGADLRVVPEQSHPCR